MTAASAIPMSMRGRTRWHAVASYRSTAGVVDAHFDLEELSEIHDLIERGPNWNTLVKIEITLNYPLVPGLTVEEAASK